MLTGNAVGAGAYLAPKLKENEMQEMTMDEVEEVEGGMLALLFLLDVGIYSYVVYRALNY